LCLDPGFGFDDCWYLPDLRGALRDYLTAIKGELRAKIVVTEIGKRVYETLDYALDERCMVLIQGLARTGKTFATKAWWMGGMLSRTHRQKRNVFCDTREKGALLEMPKPDKSACPPQRW
jgi:hypothetical protein